MPGSLHRVGLALSAALLAAGCGSTVPLSQQSQVTTGDGLSLPGPTSTDSTSSSTTGSALPPSSTTTGGSTTTTTGGVAPTSPLSGSTTGSTTAPTTTATSGARTTSPITIGVVVTKVSNASSFGVSLGNSISEKSVDDAVIAAINEQGGLAGRKIVPVYAATDTGSNNWESDFAAACANLTQDHHVVAVLGYVFNYSPSFEKCLASKGIPHLATGFNVPDRQELAKFPLQLDLSVPTIDRRGLLKLENGKADGVLTSKNKIGIISDTCPGTPTSLANVIMPKAKQLGLNIVRNVAINCPTGGSDATSAVGTLQNAVLQFASSGVDRVIFHASSEGPAALLFSLAAQTQGYHPTYVLSSLGNLDQLHGFAPAAQLANMHGYGWMPIQDVPPSAYGTRNAPQTRCLVMLKSKKLTPVNGTDYSYAYEFCEAMFVYEQGLLKTGGDSTGTRVVQAIKSLGTSFASLTNQGGSLFAADRPDAPRSARHLVYGPSRKAFQYTGPVRAIPVS